MNQGDLFADAPDGPPALRDYQIDVIERLRKRIAAGARRLILQAPTGAGKTTCSSEIVRCACEKGKRALFMAHRRRLIAQKSARLAQFGVPHGILMAGHPGCASEPVQVGSRDTLLSRSLHHDWAGFPPADLIVLDEAHNLDPICSNDGGDVYQQILRQYQRAVVIGLTATPARADGAGLGEFWDAIECTCPTSRLIAEGHLVSVRCYAPPGTRQSRHDRKPAGLTGNIVENWKKHAEGRPTVLFAAKRQEARDALKAFTDAGIPAEYMDAHTPDEEREAIIARVEAGQTLVICQVGLMVEGVDVPSLSCCIMLRAARSRVLFSQAVGRIMRPFPGKVDGVLLDHAGAVWRHGQPDEDVEWTLDANDTVDRRARAARKKRPQVACPACGLLFPSAAACPACGHPMPRRLRPPRPVRPGILVEVEKGSPEDWRNKEVRQALWNACLFEAAAMGRSAGFAAHRYREKTANWPGDDLRNVPRGRDWKRLVRDLYPQYLKRKPHAV